MTFQEDIQIYAMPFNAQESEAQLDGGCSLVNKQAL